MQSFLAESSNHSPFSLLHYNVRGVRSKYTELEFLFSSAQFQVIGLCETLLRDDAAHVYQFTNYTSVHGIQIATARATTLKKNDKPWITPAIRTSIAEKERLYTLSLKCPNA